MPKVTYVEAGGTEIVAEVPIGESVMRGAKMNGVDGILADCGGACSCGTCHVHVDAAWRMLVGPPSELEEAILEYAEEVDESSRLSCQIKLSEALDGLVVRVPSGGN